MNKESHAIADYIERLGRDLIAQIRDLPDEVLNKPLPFDKANTIFAIATHAVGMGEFWVLCLVGGKTIARNRSAEFHAQGSAAEVVARLERWIADCRTLLDHVPDSQLNEDAYPPTEFLNTGGFGDSPMALRECLLHVIEHTATHLGHIQLTKQVLMHHDG